MKDNSLDEITHYCQYLRLATFTNEWEETIKQATRQSISCEQFLLQLLRAEHDFRFNRAVQRRVNAAKFPFCKTLESFDFGQADFLPEPLIRQLANNEYLTKAQSILLIGEPGTGKSHLAIALGYEAAQAGHRVKFVTLAQLANQLVEAKEARDLSAAIKRYAQCDLLIIDEWGYVPLTKNDGELCFQVLSQRQEKRSIMITSNLPFSEWGQIFTDPRLCKAIIDRCAFNAHIIETGEQSYRLKKQLSQKIK